MFLSSIRNLVWCFKKKDLIFEMWYAWDLWTCSSPLTLSIFVWQHVLWWVCSICYWYTPIISLLLELVDWKCLIICSSQVIANYYGKQGKLEILPNVNYLWENKIRTDDIRSLEHPSNTPCKSCKFNFMLNCALLNRNRKLGKWLICG